MTIRSLFNAGAYFGFLSINFCPHLTFPTLLLANNKAAIGGGSS